MTIRVEHAGMQARAIERARLRLAGWALAIAATGTPATAAVLLLGKGVTATTGAGAIGMMTLAAFATARAFGPTGDTQPPKDIDAPAGEPVGAEPQRPGDRHEEVLTLGTSTPWLDRLAHSPRDWRPWSSNP